MIKVIGDIEIEQQYDWWFCLQHVWQTIQVPQTLTQHNRDVHIEGDFPCSFCDTKFRPKKPLVKYVYVHQTQIKGIYTVQFQIWWHSAMDCIYRTLSTACSHFHFSDDHSLLEISVSECFRSKVSDCWGPPYAPLAALEKER